MKNYNVYDETNGSKLTGKLEIDCCCCHLIIVHDLYLYPLKCFCVLFPEKKHDIEWKYDKGETGIEMEERMTRKKGRREEIKICICWKDRQRIYCGKSYTDSLSHYLQHKHTCMHTLQ